MPKLSGPKARRGRPRKSKCVAEEVEEIIEEAPQAVEQVVDLVDSIEANGDGSDSGNVANSVSLEEGGKHDESLDDINSDTVGTAVDATEKDMSLQEEERKSPPKEMILDDEEYEPMETGDDESVYICSEDILEGSKMEDDSVTGDNNDQENDAEDNKVEEEIEDDKVIKKEQEDDKVIEEEQEDNKVIEEEQGDDKVIEEEQEDNKVIQEEQEDDKVIEEGQEDDKVIQEEQEDDKVIEEEQEDDKLIEEEQEEEKESSMDETKDNAMESFSNTDDVTPLLSSSIDGGQTSLDDVNAEKLSEVSEQQDDFEDDEKPSKESENLDHDTELVSEDELPSESIKPPLDTEAVSDEELPPTHLLDTEAVSEDELPPVKKKKSESINDVPKSSESLDEDSKKGSRKRKASSSVESDESKKISTEPKCNKSLPELEKYWKAVKEDPADFTGWTYLLQYVDQEHDVEAAREAYDTFLSHYPYCYGYWRKYADYEKKKGDKSKSQDVFERGLTAIPLSVDLWLHYLNHIKNTHADDEEYIRGQYKRALDVCGIEFRSDRLWDNYIKWETEGKNLQNVCAIFDKLFKIPTQGYKTHFEKFEDFVMTNQPSKMLGVDEFLALRAEVLQKLRQKPPSEAAPAANAPPGDESDDDAEKSLTYADEETKLMREKIIASRKKVFKAMSSAVLDRWTFEEGIKRPYFHVKPLERCQLNNWRNYLDYEISQADQERTIILFERCLIACALYDEFWVKYIRYLETLSGDDIVNKIRNVYERACTIHHPKKPMLALNWAYFEENHGNVNASREILVRIEKEVPNSLQISICRINLERRSNNLEEASQLYEHYISTNKNKYATNALSIKYARFCQKILNDVDKGSEVLKKAIDKDKDNPRLYHQLLDLVFSKVPRGPEQENECLAIINQFLERETSDIEHKVLFAQHKVEFLEDFGSTASCLQKAVNDYIGFLKQVKEKRRKQYEEKMKQDESKKSKASDGSTSHSAGVSSSPSTNYSQTNYSQSNYNNSNSSNQYQTSSSYGQPYNQYNSQSDPNFWNYSQPGYNNYNQGWGSYNYY